MRILLTNDDGIESEGIRKLAENLRSTGKHEVFIIAPDRNRSGISHGVSIFSGPVKLKALNNNTWTCSGLPVDCIITGLKIMNDPPDLVISGINRGANLGSDLIYSGTAAAARQASLKNIKSIALSLDGHSNHHWDMAVSWSVDNLEKLISFWREDSFVNVNIPNKPEGPIGYALTWPAKKVYRDAIEILEAPSGSNAFDGRLFCFLIPKGETAVPEEGSDCDAVSRDLVSISPVYNYQVILRDLCPEAPPHAAIMSRKEKGE